MDYSDREVIAELAEMVKNGTKHDMERLAKAYPNGLKFEGAGFSQIIPFSVLLHFGNWDGVFPGSSNIDTLIFNEEQSADDELITGNICREVFDFINLLNKDDLFEQEVRDAFTTLNGISGWLKSIRSLNASKLVKVGETVGKKRRGKKFNYHLKVVGDTELGFDVETGLPIVELNCSANPSGYRDGNKVLLSRCPLPLFTACIVRDNPELDNSIVAVNPMIWAVSNAGDHDGDLAYLTNLYLLNGGKDVSVEECQAFNNNYSGLATHWDVFALSEGENRPLSPVLNNLGKGENQISKFVAMGAVMKGSDLIENIPNVSQHYAIGVGEFHKVSTALTEFLGNKGESISKDEVIALHKSWIDYEEFGLGGWTEDNARVLEELKGNISAEIINPGCFKPRSRRGKSVASSINWLAIEASAISEIGARVMKKQAGASDEAIIAQALKRIAKKDIAYGEALLWIEISRIVRENPDVLKPYRFGKHIEVLSQVRLQA